EEPERRERLEALCGHFRERLMEEGFETTSASGPIIPILIGDAGDALAMAAALLENGVLAPAVRPPTVPKGSSRLRLTVTASHRIEELDQAVEALCLAREAMECQRHQAYL
ncbi:MAG: 8-amino-7-oxononanoate synthase, partial [Deltaproteobacteria bacterium CG_4_10_14_3_um_filter_51_14]